VPQGSGAPGGGGMQVDGEGRLLTLHAGRLTCCAPKVLVLLVLLVLLVVEVCELTERHDPSLLTLGD
jgi:hypothetical protein